MCEGCLVSSRRIHIPTLGGPLLISYADPVQSEGVGILLDLRATAAWRNAGEVWEAVSSRIVTASLKWVGKGYRRQGGFRASSSIALSLVCAFSPTARATPGVKAQFSSGLQNTLDNVPQSNILVVLGDFNARVRVLKAVDICIYTLPSPEPINSTTQCKLQCASICACAHQ